MLTSFDAPFQRSTNVRFELSSAAVDKQPAHRSVPPNRDHAELQATGNVALGASKRLQLARSGSIRWH